MKEVFVPYLYVIAIGYYMAVGGEGKGDLFSNSEFFIVVGRSPRDASMV